MSGGFDEWAKQTGATAADVEDLPHLPFTPTLAREAYHGWAGQVVDAIAPYSEADPAAILLHVLVAAGNLLGHGPHAMVEHTRHSLNEFVAFVGRSSKARKGQAWSTPLHLLSAVDPAWAAQRVRSGLSSGEGVIYHVRDAVRTMQAIKKGGRTVDYEEVITDHGVDDKRLLVMEPEWASALRRGQEKTNSLSAVLRSAWDSGALSTLTKNSPLRATDAHVSLLVHITAEELATALTRTEEFNGHANRYLFALVHRAQVLPDGGQVPPGTLQPLVTEIQGIVAAAGPHQYVRDPTAKEVWAVVYPKLSAGEPGLIGAVLARAEAHVLRLSMLYAVLDQADQISAQHLLAALAVWNFCQVSARRIFGDKLGLPTADVILQALRDRGSMTRDAICNLFHRNVDRAAIDAALALLHEQKKATCVHRPPEGSKGRPAEVWTATP